MSDRARWHAVRAAVTVIALLVPGSGAAGHAQQVTSIDAIWVAQGGHQERARVRAGPMRREIIAGSELMTSAEREAYRRRMAGAASDADRDRIRAGHVKAMRERARLRGLRLADPDPAKPGESR